MLLKKIEIAQNIIAENINFFKCPICGADFSVKNFILKCKNNHSYDLSKKGYVNLFGLSEKIIKTYDKNLFSARKQISDSGLYDGLCKKLLEIIKNYKHDYILDAGCGCGNLTHNLKSNLNNSVIFGADLSKDGIDFAATNFFNENLIWLVANLNQLPFDLQKLDLILNIMSPANYNEFKRILKLNGVLIKVIPDADYLKELRKFIYKNDDKESYSNANVVENLRQNMNLKEIFDVKYTHSVTSENINALFDMTPLTAKINEREKIKNNLMNEMKDVDYFEVTLAFKIAVCEN